MQRISTPATHRTLPQRLPFYWGWINVIVASLAMTATLPGRTHGLGLITEPLLADLDLEHTAYARLNLIASLAGAAFCLPIGWLIDRAGVRGVVTVVVLALGASVVWMSRVQSSAELLAALLLVRGFGQSALSVVAMAMIGKWFGRRSGIAMGLFAVLLTFGFFASVPGMGAAVAQLGWRVAWRDLGYLLLAFAPLAWIFTRSTPESCGLVPDAPAGEAAGAIDQNFTLWQALASPAFWVVALGTSAFNLVWSGVTLFNESMLAEHGLDAAAAVQIITVLAGVGLLANLIAGLFARRAYILRVLAVGLALLAGGLALFPRIDGLGGAYVYGLTIGLAGGVVTVVFFAAWGQLFGRAQLGRIQAAAQLLTVLASSLGPVLMAESHAASGSYSPMFYTLAIVVALLAVANFVTPLPKPPAPPLGAPLPDANA